VTGVPQPLILVGGGEHASVVADAALSSGNWDIVGVIDAGTPRQALLDSGVRHLGDDDALTELLEALEPGEPEPWLVVSVGGVVEAAVRRGLAERLGARRWATVVHSSAWVSPSAVLEGGAVVMAGAVVNAGARVGAHAIVNTAAVVEHDVVVGAFVRIAPGAVIGGGVQIGEDALIGLGAAIRDHITIGDRAVVGMGSVVTRNVVPGATVAGLPARIVG
jgi:acetyltransferase EpsM